MVSVNVVVLAGSLAGEPVRRRLPSGDAVTELRVSVADPRGRVLPLPVAAWDRDLDTEAAGVVEDLARGDQVLVCGRMVRRFYRSGAGARSLTEVVVSGIKKLEAARPQAAEVG